MHRALYAVVFVGMLQVAWVQQIQNCTRLEDTSTTCQGHWPLFNSAAQLNSDRWGKYFKAVYGEIPQGGYPMCLGDFWIFYSEELAAAGITLPQDKSGCPPSEGSRNWQWWGGSQGTCSVLHPAGN